MFSKFSLRDVPGYSKALYCTKWNKEGSHLAAISGDRSVKISSFNPGNSNLEIISTLPTSYTMSQLCWHPYESNRLALCSDDKSIEIWDIRGDFSFSLTCLAYALFFIS
jgi:WD40 repeat protein